MHTLHKGYRIFEAVKTLINETEIRCKFAQCIQNPILKKLSRRCKCLNASIVIWTFIWRFWPCVKSDYSFHLTNDIMVLLASKHFWVSSRSDQTKTSSLILYNQKRAFIWIIIHFNLVFFLQFLLLRITRIIFCYDSIC